MTAETEAPDIGDRSAFIASLYLGLLRRPADAREIGQWIALMDQGATTVDVVYALSHKPDAMTQLMEDAQGQAAEPPSASTAMFAAYRPPASEAARSYEARLQSGFLDRYCSGEHVLDVGFTGYANPEGKTALPQAIGIDLDYPGYDGTRLPFEDGSIDTVFSSHCLEHIADDQAVIRDWFRVLKVGGFIVCIVPHQGLYEKKAALPSYWNGDHKRMYTPASLIASFEDALEINSYRVRHLADNDEGFNYALGPEHHSDGAYEIELVIEKIVPPAWDLEGDDDDTEEPGPDPLQTPPPPNPWKRLADRLKRG